MKKASQASRRRRNFLLFVYCKFLEAEKKKKMNTRGKGKAILGIAIVAIMLATLMVPAITAKDMTNGYVTSRNGYQVNPGFVVIELTEGDRDMIKIGQEIIFKDAEGTVLIQGIPDTNTDGAAYSVSAFVTETVTDVAGIAGNDKTIDGVYFDTSSLGRTGTYIVSCGGISQQVSVSRPRIPLELKVGTEVVSAITVGTNIRIDCSGASNLSPYDCVNLIITDSKGRQMKSWTVGDKTQYFDAINVAQLVEYGSTNPAMQIDTSDWLLGTYTFSVVTEEENARGLDLSSPTKSVTRSRAKSLAKSRTQPKGEDNISDRPSTVVVEEGPELTAEISSTSVAQEDEFTVMGIAEGSDFVDIVTIAPKGGFGRGINPASVPDVPGITYERSAVSDIDYSYLKEFYVDEDAETGEYMLVLVSPGRNGVYDELNSPDLFGSAFVNRYGKIEGLGSKTQEQISAIIAGLTIEAVGSDDLLVLGYINVEAPVVTRNPISGEYTVTADDGDRHTDDANVSITGGRIEGDREEGVEETSATPEPTPAPPGFEVICTMMGLLAVAYIMHRKDK